MTYLENKVIMKNMQEVEGVSLNSRHLKRLAIQMKNISNTVKIPIIYVLSII